MRYFRITSVVALAACVFTGTRAESLAEGVQAFQARDYAAAKTHFAAELAQSPGDTLASLWLGLAIHATEGLFSGADQWRVATGNPAFESHAEFFRGLSYWKAGYVNDAKAYFNDALMNIVDGKAVDYPPARQALADLAAGRPAPRIDTWPTLARLPAAHAPAQLTTPPAPAPIAPPRVANPPRQPARPPAAVRGYVAWEPAGTHRIGDRVLFRVINSEWRVGIVREVGTTGTFRDKYLIEEEARAGSRNYYYYTDVTGLERADFWTGFFIGEWALGSGMAVNERVTGGNARNEYLYVGSNETLVIKPDGTYTWSTLDQPVRTGRWRAHPTAPGLILERGVRDRDYEVFNITDPATVSVMKEHHLRVQTPGIQSTLGRRKIP
jgi:hypothetical protein